MNIYIFIHIFFRNILLKDYNLNKFWVKSFSIGYKWETNAFVGL
jgi:hypothetical protein